MIVYYYMSAEIYSPLNSDSAARIALGELRHSHGSAFHGDGRQLPREILKVHPSLILKTFVGLVYVLVPMFAYLKESKTENKTLFSS